MLTKDLTYQSVLLEVECSQELIDGVTWRSPCRLLSSPIASNVLLFILRESSWVFGISLTSLMAARCHWCHWERAPWIACTDHTLSHYVLTCSQDRSIWDTTDIRRCRVDIALTLSAIRLLFGWYWFRYGWLCFLNFASVRLFSLLFFPLFH